MLGIDAVFSKPEITKQAKQRNKTNINHIHHNQPTKNKHMKHTLKSLGTHAVILITIGSLTGGANSAVIPLKINQSFSQGTGTSDLPKTRVSLGGAGFFLVDPGASELYLNFDFSGSGAFASNGTSPGGSPWMRSFGPGETITGSMDFDTSAWTDILNDGTTTSPWDKSHSGFIGFRATNGELGYISYDFTRNLEVSTITLNSGAFESVPGEPITIGAAPTLALADALDTTNFTWATSGRRNWFRQTTTNHDGVDAAQSGRINDNQSSSMETTLNGAGTLTFWWKVSSESTFDHLRFYLDGVEQTGDLAKISGEVDWTQKTVNIPTGSHTAKWAYTKDSSNAVGFDAGWVDQVVFTNPETDVPEIDVQQPRGFSRVDGIKKSFGTVAIGSSNNVRFFIKNAGTSDLVLQSAVADGANPQDFTKSKIRGVTVAPGESLPFIVGFTPTAEGTRTAQIHILSNDEDEGSFDIRLTGTGVAR
jgi:hypothetical protein